MGAPGHTTEMKETDESHRAEVGDLEAERASGTTMAREDSRCGLSERHAERGKGVIEG